MARLSFARDKVPSPAAKERPSDTRTTTTRPFINEYRGNLRIVASCPRWQFGNWHGEPAWLFQLEFLFIPGFRLPKAEIDIAFSTGNDRGDAVTVQAFGPAQLQGSTTTDTIGTKHAFTPTVTVGIPIANLGLALASEHDSSYARIWDGFIEGDASPTSGHVTRNHIKWFLSEDPKQSLGIPSKFQPAVIVSCKHGASFTMQCEITLDPGLRHWWGISKNPLVWAKSRIHGIPVTLNSAARDGSPLPLVQLAARVVSDDAAPERQSKDPPSAVDFGTMTLDQWQRIWSSTWPSARVDTLDRTATIFDVLHQSVTLGTQPVKPTAPTLKQQIALLSAQLPLGSRLSVSGTESVPAASPAVALSPHRPSISVQSLVQPP